jgi:alpha-tubulin suppressor-like RCC1 family protein
MRGRMLWRAVGAAVAAGCAVAPAPASGDDARIATGHAHTCVLQGDGRVLCVGANGQGQLGNSSFIDSRTPVVVRGLEDAAGVAAGRERSCAVTRDGGAWCWGANAFGELGDGTTTFRTRPVRFRARAQDGSSRPLAGATAIDTGWSSTCALADGRVWCAGSDEHGQLGSEPPRSSAQPLALPVPLDGVVAHAVGTHHACAVRDDGTVWCWGSNRAGQAGGATATCDAQAPCAPTPIRVEGVSGATAVSAGFRHTCALRRDGAVLCWGSSADPLATGPSAPAVVLEGATSVTAGLDLTCATRTDGSLTCWGRNVSGQLGRGTVSPFEPAAPALIQPAVRGVSAGWEHTCARRQDEVVWCWGNGTSGELGYRPAAFGFSSIPTATPMRAG